MCGKSTLLNILAALDLPTGGRAMVASHELLAMGAKKRRAFRRSTVGFLWRQTSRNLLGRSAPARRRAQTARQIMGLISSVVHAEGLTAIATTHDRGLMDIADRS